jgi:hypothetical protein
MPIGKRGDKNLHITFNEMGHGDNVLISLPNGKMVVIDCGSMRWDGNYWNPKRKPKELFDNAMYNALSDERFLLNNKTIDLLILTHPDLDHCSQLFGLFTWVTLDKKVKPANKLIDVFFSNRFTEYGKHGVPGVIWTSYPAKNIYALTLNQTTSTYSKVTEHNVHGTVLSDNDITVSANNQAELYKKSRVAATLNFVKLLDGTAVGGVDCAVYALASNVTPYANLTDNSSEDNRGSIVTMIIFGDKKFLFMGDSTFNTEHFLIQTYGDLIKDVELLHIPHHSSYNTSSSYPGHPERPNLQVDFVAAGLTHQISRGFGPVHSTDSRSSTPP